MYNNVYYNIMCNDNTGNLLCSILCSYKSLSIDNIFQLLREKQVLEYYVHMILFFIFEVYYLHIHGYLCAQQMFTNMPGIILWFINSSGRERQSSKMQYLEYQNMKIKKGRRAERCKRET